MGGQAASWGLLLGCAAGAEGGGRRLRIEAAYAL
jgi:hypothetical protein